MKLLLQASVLFYALLLFVPGSLPAQIEKLHYTDALSEFEPTKIYKYAIACYKKHCKVTMTEETWQK